jgi:hypothetical protein
MTYNTSDPNHIYLLIIYLCHNNHEIVQYLIQKKMIGRIIDVFFFDLVEIAQCH